MDDFFRVFFSSGHVAHLILLVMLVEGIVLIAIYRKTQRGIRPSRLIASLSAGVALVLALRASLTGLGWPWMALALSAAFVAHLVDLYWRWTDVH